MKRIVCSILCLALLLPLSACGETEYERIPLTVDNYEEYININMYITDYCFAITKQTSSGPWYSLSCVVHFETSKKVDCTFEDVSIAYTPKRDGITHHHWEYSVWAEGVNGELMLNPETALDFEGHSHISFAATVEEHPALDFLTFSLTSKRYWNVDSIQGYVVVPKK